MADTTRPATASRFDDVATLLAPKKEGAQGCWCLSIRLGHTEEQKLRNDARADAVRDLCARRGNPPGVLAYEAGEVVGWAGVGPRDELREFAAKKYPGAQPGEWVVYCFRVRAGHTGQGHAHALLRAAVDLAQDKGANELLGFPIDNGAAKVNRTLASVGVRSMFEAAGFEIGDAISGSRDGKPQVVARKTF